MQSAKTTLLCAIRFWAGAGGIEKTIPTLRRGVRSVVRRQGVTPTEIDRAERQLLKSGLIARGGKRSGATIALTNKGLRVANRACPAVHLPPWRPYPHHMPPGAVAGATRGRRR